ncbi:bifunctional DNA primase/polymerase [Halorubrum ezzemoulense]|uniref:bifunctional DNA primase/polymerase n=1 Tax=Halorubrum ezzemoulense TaxID=337243 RepID=UPI00117B1138|nr:bifunctional DNA primase/polymerase [Halorubrum ezzemoulense]
MADVEGDRLIVSPSRSTEFHRLKQHVEERLEGANVRAARSVSLPHGSKMARISNHEQATTQERPSEIYGNYTIHGGDRLVILDIDVDNPSDLPEWVRSLPKTFAVETVHDGLHLYYTVEDDTDISNTKVSWGSVRYGWYSVGPGSAVDHDAECKNCGKTGRTPYTISKDRSIATLSGKDLDNLRDVCQSEEDDSTSDTASTSTGSNAGFTEPDEAFTDEAERYICTIFVPRHATELAGSDLMDSLRGGTGSYRLRRDDDPDSIDRSAADYYVLEWLYGAFLFRGDDSDTAREQALAVFKRYCSENRYDKTGNLRKCFSRDDGDTYLEEQMDAVEEYFDFGAWHRWRRRQYEDGFDPDEHRPWTDPGKDGEPSLVTKDTVRAAVSILTRGVDPEWAGKLYGLDISSLYASEDDSFSDSTTLHSSSCREICTPPRACSCGDTSRSESRKYPTAKEVGRLAVALNPDRERSYFEETLKQLQRETGEFARAVCDNRENGQRHVYFPSGIEPPEDADEVHCNGEQYEPALFPESKHNHSEEDDQRLVTDGGTDFKSPSVPVVWAERENRSKSGSSPSMVLTTTLLIQNLLNDSVLLDVG